MLFALLGEVFLMADHGRRIPMQRTNYWLSVDLQSVLRYFKINFRWKHCDSGMVGLQPGT